MTSDRSQGPCARLRKRTSCLLAIARPRQASSGKSGSETKLPPLTSLTCRSVSSFTSISKERCLFRNSNRMIMTWPCCRACVTEIAGSTDSSRPSSYRGLYIGYLVFHLAGTLQYIYASCAITLRIRQASSKILRSSSRGRPRLWRRAVLSSDVKSKLFL